MTHAETSPPGRARGLAPHHDAGIERRKIFMDERDREDFLERLSKLLPQIETGCYAWVFIPNHFLFRTGLVHLA